MGKYNDFGARIRSWGGRGPNAGSYAGSVTLTAQGSFDPTATSQVALFTLPSGAIPLATQSFGGATGGTNPTVNIGTSGDPDGIAAGLDADGTAFDGASGALIGTAFTTDTAVYGVVGGSAATGGTTSVAVWYVMEDEFGGGDRSGS